MTFVKMSLNHFVKICKKILKGHWNKDREEEGNLKKWLSVVFLL